eukprot:m.121307 g.121307  ORF g.121307 m.121307 type:complete len:490 (+) comp9293_c0_seq3:201-1670(+)
MAQPHDRSHGRYLGGRSAQALQAVRGGKIALDKAGLRRADGIPSDMLGIAEAQECGVPEDVCRHVCLRAERFLRRRVEWIREPAGSTLIGAETVVVLPHGVRAPERGHERAVALAVQQERAVAARERLVPQRHQERLCVIKLQGKLVHQLVHAVEEQQENRCNRRGVGVCLREMAQPLAKGMPEKHKLLHDEELEPFLGAIIRVDDELDERTHDAVKVGNLTASDEHAYAPAQHRVCNIRCNLEARVHQRRPAGRLQRGQPLRLRGRGPPAVQPGLAENAQALIRRAHLIDGRAQLLQADRLVVGLHVRQHCSERIVILVDGRTRAAQPEMVDGKTPHGKALSDIVHCVSLDCRTAGHCGHNEECRIGATRVEGHVAIARGEHVVAEGLTVFGRLHNHLARCGLEARSHELQIGRRRRRGQRGRPVRGLEIEGKESRVRAGACKVDQCVEQLLDDSLRSRDACGQLEAKISEVLARDVDTGHRSRAGPR